MTDQDTNRYILDKLKTVYEAGEARAISRLVTEYLFESHSKVAILNIDSNTRKSLESIVNELIESKPIQYVLNEAWFWNLKFFVDENVLIPRPETEELVKYIIDCEKTRPVNVDSFSILDIGSGSGCIPIALKKELPNAQITSMDISGEALKIARTNSESLDADVQFLEMDFLNEQDWQMLGKFSIIISNPPYIPLQEKETLDKTVADWEPGTALFVPDNDPLLFYRKIAVFGKTHLAGEGNIFLECHQNFAQATVDLFLSHGYAADLKKDIFNNDRMVRAWL